MTDVGKLLRASFDEAMKSNIMAIVKKHKEKCDGPDCGVSLFLVRMLAEKAGIEFTEEERCIFL